MVDKFILGEWDLHSPVLDMRVKTYHCATIDMGPTTRPCGTRRLGVIRERVTYLIPISRGHFRSKMSATETGESNIFIAGS